MINILNIQKNLNIVILCIILVLLILILFSLYYKKSNFENKPTSKNLVFTSAGNNTQFHTLWLNGNPNFDTWCIYYGDNDEKYNEYKKKVKYIERRKGGKFQNFHYIYNKYRDLVLSYERFFILDDDIIFETKDINKMFDISIEYDLDICGPTFKPTGGKISHEITTQRPNSKLRYTNFIEVGVSLFNKKALINLMKYYDPILIGWGIDYLSIWANGQDKKDKYALIDEVSCINPHDNTKSNGRENKLVKGFNNEANIWHKFKNKLNISVPANITYKTIPI
tara:strand:- start:1676 stop:2518 length:843 start_codon:yes stop_codon:yes gene_type:complete